MGFSLIPRELKFFDMFDEATATLTRASKKFLDLVTQFDKLDERSQDLKKEEHTGDDIVERIIKALDSSFITPFDREDIHALTARIDDVLDNMEETAHRFMVFRIAKPPEAAVALARIVHESCGHIQQAVRLCRSLKNAEAIQRHLLEIGRLENEADKIYRDSDSALFAQPPDILMLIKLRELYSWLEETVDSCKDVANVLSEIVIKGS
jgi:predicted phosphate transport protein (TIGR00153 family)